MKLNKFTALVIAIVTTDKILKTALLRWANESLLRMKIP